MPKNVTGITVINSQEHGIIPSTSVIARITACMHARFSPSLFLRNLHTSWVYLPLHICLFLQRSPVVAQSAVLLKHTSQPRKKKGR